MNRTSSFAALMGLHVYPVAPISQAEKEHRKEREKERDQQRRAARIAKRIATRYAEVI